MKVKKGLALLLSAAIMLSMISLPAFAAGEEAAPVAPAFHDVSGHWGAAPISRWSDLGVVKGDDNGNFHPDSALSRAELAQIFVNLLGLTAKMESTYADLEGTEWYADAILKCTAAGILKGDGVKASAESSITRQEAMVMFGRAMGVTPAAKADLSKFSDAADVADWAAGYMAPLAAMGIISGGGDGAIMPTANIDRASTMALLDKAIEAYLNTAGTFTAKNAKGFVVVNAAGGESVVSGATAGVVVAAGKVAAKDLTADTMKVDGIDAVSIEGKSSVGSLTVNGKAPITIAKGAAVDTLIVNAPAVITNNGTVKTLICNVSGVIFDGNKPRKVESAPGTEAPRDSKGKVVTGAAGGGGNSVVSHDAIEDVSINFLFFKPDGDGKVDLAQFRADLVAVTSEKFITEGAGQAAYKALADKATEGKVALKDAESVYVNLPWVGVRYTAYETLTGLTVNYKKDGSAGVFTEQGEDARSSLDLDGNLLNEGAHWFSVCVGSPVVANDTGLGYGGDEAYGTYSFTLAAATGVDKSAKTTLVTKTVDFLGTKTADEFCTVTFETKGAMDSKTLKVLKDRSITLAAPEYKAEYLFREWTGGESTYESGAVVAIKKDVNFTAREFKVEAQTVATRGNGPAVGMDGSDYNYAAAYGKAGVSLGGTAITVNEATLTAYVGADENQKDVIAMSHRVEGVNYLFYGVAYTKPAGALKVSVGGSATDALADELLELAADSEDIYNGQLIDYYSFAEEDEGVWTAGQSQTFTPKYCIWYGENDSILKVTKVQLSRVLAVDPARMAGDAAGILAGLNRYGKVTLARNITLTEADKGALAQAQGVIVIPKGITLSGAENLSENVEPQGEGLVKAAMPETLVSEMMSVPEGGLVRCVVSYSPSSESTTFDFTLSGTAASGLGSLADEVFNQHKGFKAEAPAKLTYITLLDILGGREVTLKQENPAFSACYTDEAIQEENKGAPGTFKKNEETQRWYKEKTYKIGAGDSDYQILLIENGNVTVTCKMGEEVISVINIVNNLTITETPVES